MKTKFPSVFVTKTDVSAFIPLCCSDANENGISASYMYLRFAGMHQLIFQNHGMLCTTQSYGYMEENKKKNFYPFCQTGRRIVWRRTAYPCINTIDCKGSTQ